MDISINANAESIWNAFRMHIDFQHSSYFVHQQFVQSSLGLNLCVQFSAEFLLQFWKQQEESVRLSAITERK